VEAANALIATEPPPRDGVELARLATARLGKTVIDASDVTVSVGDGRRAAGGFPRAGARGGLRGAVPPGQHGERVLLDDVTWQLGPGDRVGLIGPNGSGKTTLLDLLAGPGDGDTPSPPDGAPGDPDVDGNRRGSGGLSPHSGEPGRDGGEEPGNGLSVTGRITRGKTVRLGYLRQTDAGLDPSLTPREAITEVHGTLESAQGAAAASQLLDRLGLRGDTQWTPAGELSGGERRRLQLLRLLVGEPNVLFLDEPTNDLDVDTLTELEDLLDGWPGSLVLVSHDRYFLERVTDHVLALLGDGRLSYLPGGVDEYLQLRLEPDSAGRSSAAGSAVGRRPAAGHPGQPGPGATTAKTSQPGSAAAQRAASKEMQRLERQIDRLTGREAELTAALAEHASDYVRLTELGAELRGVQDEKNRLEEQWLQAAEQSTG
jgi:ATP-binding cassette subfamily F protein uup